PSISRVGGNTPTDRLGPKVRFAHHATTPDDVIGIAAPQFNRAHGANGLSWTVIPNLGQSEGAVLALPQGRPATSVEEGVRLEYDVRVKRAGPAVLTLHLAPTLDTLGKDGLHIGVSIDERPVHILTAALEPSGGAQDTPNKTHWSQSV